MVAVATCFVAHVECLGSPGEMWDAYPYLGIKGLCSLYGFSFHDKHPVSNTRLDLDRDNSNLSQCQSSIDSPNVDSKPSKLGSLP